MLPVERHIRDTIQAEGAIPFARFMVLALYSPLGGYYRSASPVGASGDYFTSPTAHPLFGSLLAAQLSQMWETLGRPDPFTVLEPGAGSGVMARDILETVHADFPDLARAMRYLALDHAPAKPESAPPCLQWAASDGLPVRGMVGCILANELLDAMPVSRFVVNGGVTREVYVTIEGEGFAEVLGKPSTAASAELMTRLPADLPEGYRGEVCPAAVRWISEAASTLDRGYVLAFDYGGTSAELNLKTVKLASTGYLDGLRAVCDANDWLLMLDEVQTGNGRTGRYFAYQHTGIVPDVVATAKGLGNGVPIGACLARGEAAKMLVAGTHGSTFGGNFLVCAAANAVVDELTDGGIIDRAAELGERMLARFRDRLAGNNRVKEIRGKGLMLAVELNEPCTELVGAAVDAGLLINVAADTVVRLLPPLNMSDDEADTMVDEVVALIGAMPG
jgi:hypothetical protein